MKKLLIASAALAMVAGTAQAQSSVTVYGNLDVNYSSVDSDAAGAGKATAQSKGTLSTSRLGFKGDEDLGAGLKAQFQLEAEVNPNTGAVGGTSNTNMFGREAWAGFSSSTLGSVRLGSTDVTSAQSIDSTVSQLGDLGNTSGDIGADKAQTIRYTTPTFSGFTAEVGHSNALATTKYDTDATSSTTAAGKITSAFVKYEAGALGVYAGQSIAKTTATYDRKDSKFGVKYDFGFASVGAVYSTLDAADEVTDGAFGKAKQTVISVAAPLSALGSGVKIHAAYHRTDSANGDRSTTATTATATDTTLSDSKKTTVALTKAFSKRTTGYIGLIDSNFDKADKADTTTYTVGVNHAF
jgi:general bacterial porin, GBP family